MIKNPVLLVGFLLSIEIIVLYLAAHAKTKHWFDFVPSIFWIYFLPMMASSLGVIDAKSPVYAHVTNYLLPVSLFILLVTVDIKAILQLGYKALFMFFIGAFGIGLGVVLTFVVFKGFVGAEFWSGFGALSGSWTGGSANMIAVKEALGTPDQVFLPMVIVDTVVPYAWMGLLVICAHHQHRFDTFIKADRQILNDIDARLKFSVKENKGWSFKMTFRIVMIGILGATIAISLARFMPQIKNVITTFAWTIICVSTLAIAVSFTKIKEIESYGSNRIGYFILYFVLTTIGAKASVSNIGSAAILIGAGFVIVLIHAVILLTAAWVMRAPLFLVAAASQANVGGVASAPMVAELYQKGFASVGLLLAILGNLVGTYIGILVGQICRAFA